MENNEEKPKLQTDIPELGVKPKFEVDKLSTLKGKNPVGRPTAYTPELAVKICDLLSEGISLRTVCLAEDMPDKSTVFRWLRDNKDFQDQYARAKEESADALFEEINDIADETHSLIKSTAEKKAGAVAQAQRLRVDTRKWYMSKMKPKKYGDSLDLTSGGKAIKGNTIIVKDFSKIEPKDDATNDQH